MSSTDITYCVRDCGNMECKRNKEKLKNFEMGDFRTLYISQCSFDECKEWKPNE